MKNIASIIKRAMQASSITAVANALAGITSQGRNIRMHRVAVLLSICCVALLAGPAAWSQAAQRTKIAFEVHEQNSKYTQQHTLDIGDMPGHTIRLFELHRTFPDDPPAFAGVAIKDYWSRGESESLGGNGPVFTYSVFNMANGDKIFGRFDGVAQATAGQSADKRTVVGNLVLTGGTGKMRGIRGTLHVLTNVDLSKNLNDTRYEGEYWMEKK
jgi:ABC-type nickel/cobalt efflux system permease component RcnA